MALRSLSCAIEQIVEWHPELYLESHAAACVALMSQYGSSPHQAEVECEHISSAWLGRSRRFRLQVSWSAGAEVNAERLRHTVQRNVLVEMAAIAVALLLTPAVVDLGQLDVVRHGDR